MTSTWRSQCRLVLAQGKGWDGPMTVGFRLLFTNPGLLLDDAPQDKAVDHAPRWLPYF